MIKTGIMIDPHTEFKIQKKGKYDNKRIDELYVKFEGELIPAAYVYPLENEVAVLDALNRLKVAKKAFEDVQAEIFYKVLPKLR